jgi:transposase InsO family protein
VRDKEGLAEGGVLKKESRKGKVCLSVAEDSPVRKRYPYEVRRKAVQLHLEEGIGVELVVKELGVPRSSVWAWVRRYKELGEAGLRIGCGGGSGSKVAKPVQEEIVRLKRENPRYGVRRISQMLKRLFCFRASPGTVRRHLKVSGIVAPKVRVRKKPKAPERRFEAATPNQMWQTDITYFPILGKTAYIIGFIDDNSRYITGLGVYRSQTSENVVEVYRLATGEFGVPREMLTDNGRQYASWRGVTKFQQELKRDHIHHIRSSPHHPQTLGKIERFWQSLKDEFLSRARFETFEEARERIAYWVKYYNHKRTHQSLEGMTPADRFFKIQDALRGAIERQVADNVEEMALRGKPVEPFYMVGRVGDRSVVIETDKKRVSVMVDGQEMHGGESMVYEVNRKEKHETGATRDGGAKEEAANAGVQREGKEPGGVLAVERQTECVGADEGVRGGVGSVELMGEARADGNAHGVGSELEAAGRGAVQAAGSAGEADGEDDEAGSGNNIAGGIREKEETHEEDRTRQVRGGGEMPGSTGGMDGKETGIGSMQRDGDRSLAVMPVAGSGALGYIGGLGAEGQAGRDIGAASAGAGQTTAGSESAIDRTAERGEKHWLAAETGQRQGPGSDGGDPCGFLNREVVDGGNGRESGKEAAGYPGSSVRAPECHAGGAGVGCEPQDVLRLAGTRTHRDASGAEGPANRPSAGGCGSGEGIVAGGVAATGTGTGRTGIAAENTGSDSGDVGRIGQGIVAA